MDVRAIISSQQRYHTILAGTEQVSNGSITKNSKHNR